MSESRNGERGLYPRVHGNATPFFSKSPRLIAYLLWLGLVAILTLLTVEGLCYLFPRPTINPPGMDQRIALPEYTIGIRTNNLGMREDGDIPPKPARETRVLLVGDSFVFGLGVQQDETLSAMLQKEISAPNARVLNGGSSGGGPLQYLHVLRNVAIPLRVDLAIVCIFLGNDLDNTHEPYLVFPHTWKNAFKRFLPNSYLWLSARKHHRGYKPGRKAAALGRYLPWDDEEPFRLARKEGIAREEMQRRIDSLAPEILESAKAGDYHSPILYNALLHPELLNDIATLESPGMQAAMRRVQATLKKMHSLCAKNSLRLAVALIPAGQQVNDEQWELWRSMGFRVNPDKARQTRPQEALRATCEALGIPCLDLLPLLREAPVQQVHYPRDGHWTPETVRYVAGAMRQFLEDQSLLDS